MAADRKGNEHDGKKRTNYSRQSFTSFIRCSEWQEIKVFGKFRCFSGEKNINYIMGKAHKAWRRTGNAEIFSFIHKPCGVIPCRAFFMCKRADVQCQRLCCFGDWQQSVKYLHSFRALAIGWPMVFKYCPQKDKGDYSPLSLIIVSFIALLINPPNVSPLESA